MAGLTRWATLLVWTLLLVALAACVAFSTEWLRTLQINSAIRERKIEQLKPLPSDARAHYAAAWDLERSQQFDQAIALFTEVRATTDATLAATAWFAVGNVYFESGIKASRDSMHEGAGESAEFDLARDAYRAALRIDPELHGVRYNLELLERLAPARPGEGWLRNTDPISIQPDRHNGWTTIQESAKRGLP
jgi:mxaK protein